MRNKTRLSRLVFSLFCLVAIFYGYAFDNWIIGTLAAVIGLGYLGIASDPNNENGDGDAPSNRTHTKKRRKTRSQDLSESGIDPNQLVEQMIEQGQVALLLRPQIIQELSDGFRSAAISTFAQTTALIDSGQVVLLPFHTDGGEAADSQIVDVDPFFIDRYPVTNYDFYQFVADDGYAQESLWEAEVVPALAQFVDQSGKPGPRFWKDGKCLSGMSMHPVVGVCWYEAMAYARWAGKRLPSDPEWVRAATNPLTMPDGSMVCRRYPWGDSMDQNKANLWSTESFGTVPVTQFKGGATLDDVHQLIGNVWEWMYNDFGIWNGPTQRLESDQPLKGLRGAAFDTYFDSQATGQFMSGDECLARRANIGFRCAVAAKDLATDQFNEVDEASDQSECELVGALG